MRLETRNAAANSAASPVLLFTSARPPTTGSTRTPSYTPRDGNLVVSLPEQNWVIKIDYNDGKGSGKVLWRLGDDGDLKPDKEDKLAWFSYQHDAAFEPPGSDTLVLFDHGHARQKKDDKKGD